MKQNQSGRSMIEMLGVLAIIAVLTVGGIAGYSKAMEKFKVNKMLEDLSFLIAGLIEHSEQLVKMSNQKPALTCIGDFARDANFFPETWKRRSACDFYDSMGNLIGIYTYSGNVALEISLGGSNDKRNENNERFNDFSSRKCEVIYLNLIQPLHDILDHSNFIRTSGSGIIYYGDKTCSGSRRCLRDLTPSEINKLCNSCSKGKEVCDITITFH